jgi:hypothetical protein
MIHAGHLAASTPLTIEITIYGWSIEARSWF